MGLFDKFKSQRDIAKEEIVEVPWHLITSSDQIDELVAESSNKPVVIFKHSTTCGISRMVLRSFEKNYALSEEDIKLYFLDLKQYRSISNEIAERFQVHHESPQLIVIKNGKTVHHDSHQGIDADHLKQFI